ncbi:hypothetical protein TNCV_5116881 [Trichonephila clavipes]|nr:hypothetical protein TNCV_5116881 [Trichonephila clavipes]
MLISSSRDDTALATETSLDILRFRGIGFLSCRYVPRWHALSTCIGYRFLDSSIFSAHCIENVNGLAVVHSCRNIEFAVDRKAMNLFFNEKKYITETDFSTKWSCYARWKQARHAFEVY